MSHALAGYISDVAYVRHFIDELIPSRLRLAAATGGVTPPPADDFDYCEIGCAHGDTTAALAAAHPRARFLGVDIVGEHIVSAKKLARDGALENVGFLESDFEALIEEDIGDFDFIAAHGVLSWISPEKRRALERFVQAKLKPGGLFYVSYNAMPGWSGVEPLRQLLLSPLGGSPDAPTMERAKLGLHFAQTMANAGAEYFARNPSSNDMLATMTKVGLPYVVHEYLHDHWSPMYFARVAWEMAEHDLHFAGVVPLHQNFRDTAVSEKLEKVFADATDRLTFESLKDFAINEFFRRDVYVKGKTSRSPAALDAFLDATAWEAAIDRFPESRTMKLPHRVLKLEAPIFEPLFLAFREGAATIEELRASRPELAGWPPDQVRAAVLRLLLAELIVPMQRPTKAQAVDPSGKFTVPHPYNQMMLKRLSSDTPLVLASEVAGTALRSSALEVLAMRVLTECRAEERDAWVEAFVEKHEMRLAIDGKIVADRAEQKRHVREAIATLGRDRLAKLVELGIMSPVR
jgi:SAM-dependent methyltransferase